MRVGSLVELVDDNFSSKDNNFWASYGCVAPIKGIVYTARSLYDDKLRLEEIINPTFGNYEPGYFVSRFRELQPPIANIEQHIKENSLEPELI